MSFYAKSKYFISMNYQLAHTNIALSGQMQWDLVVKRQDGELVVGDFHLTPVSPNIPFNKYNDESLLNYAHQENIRSFFEKTEGYFWETLENPELSHSWPMIQNSDTDSHCGIFEMGCRRQRYQLYGKQLAFLCPLWIEELSDDISLQFHIEIGGASQWDSESKSWKDYTAYASRTLDLRINGDSYHDKFVDYFHNYLKFTGLSEGSKEVMEINLAAKTAWITGVEVSSGNIITKPIHRLCDDLLYRERPLMEFDSLIINSFNENQIIAKQLFNFCLHFNLEDIIDQELLDLARGQNVAVSCSVSTQNINDTGDPVVWEIRDFYNNFEYIPKQQIGMMPIERLAQLSYIASKDEISGRVEEYSGEIPNVLSYLGDNKYVDIISKNKIVPNIIHWSLQDNPEYIFNIYNGFGGFVDRNGEPVCKAYIYGDAPDLLKTKNASHFQEDTQIIEPSNIGWCNAINCTWDTLKRLLVMGGSSNWKEEDGSSVVETEAPNYAIYDNASDFTKYWTKYVKYAKTVQDIAGAQKILSMRVILIKLPDGSDIQTLQTTDNIVRLKYFKDSDGDNRYDLCWAIDPNGINLIYLISSDFNSLTFRRVLQILNEQEMIPYWEQHFESEEDYQEWLDSGVKDNYFWNTLMPELREMMRNVISPPLVSFSYSLDPYKADSPSYSTNEISYFKNDQADPSKCFVLRYDGHISPTFITLDQHRNYLYFKDVISDDRSNGLSQLQKSLWAQYVRTGFNPNYPSIGYYSYKYQEIDYTHPNIISTTLTPDRHPICQNFEYSWFNNGSMLILKPELEFNVYTKFQTINGQQQPLPLDDLIRDWLKSYYNGDDAKIDYILSLYETESSFEYDYSGVTAQDPQWFLTHYVYAIKMILK